jgi:RNA polymerase sigma-70 factor (ECF subfamily)
MTQDQFVEHINKHQGIIFKICKIYGQDSDDRQDLYQEILLQAWKGSPSFRGESSFSTWLYRISINTALSWQKQTKRRWALVEEARNELNQQAFSDSLLHEEQFAAMHKAIEKLEKIDKALVALYLEDLDYKTIGEILGISANYVAVKLNRIKTYLKTQLQH